MVRRFRMDSGPWYWHGLERIKACALYVFIIRNLETTSTMVQPMPFSFSCKTIPNFVPTVFRSAIRARTLAVPRIMPTIPKCRPVLNDQIQKLSRTCQLWRRKPEKNMWLKRGNTGKRSRATSRKRGVRWSGRCMKYSQCFIGHERIAFFILYVVSRISAMVVLLPVREIITLLQSSHRACEFTTIQRMSRSISCAVPAWLQ